MDRQPAGLSPDGTQIAFTSNRRGDYDIFRKRVSGIEEAELLVGNFGLDVPRGWSPDASLLLVDCGPHRPPFFPGGLQAALEEILGRKVDVVTESSLHPKIHGRILREALPL